MAKPSATLKEKFLREIENCRVVDIGIEKFGECLKQGPATCAYALPFGYCFLCGHPNVSDIIENTKKSQASQIS